MGDLLSPEEQKEFLSIANAETDRLSRLVTDVLDLSRLESDRVWQLEPMDLAPAIEQTLRTYRLNAEEKGVTLIFAGDQHLPRVRGNWDLLLQVFDNLVGNALKFTRDGGQLLLRAYPWPDHCPLDPGASPGDNPSCALTSPAPAAGRDRRHRLRHFRSRPGADLRAVFPGGERRSHRGWHRAGTVDRARHSRETRQPGPHGQ